jgi:dinuclear metal center YbgI/SA1388 family protein
MDKSTLIGRLNEELRLDAFADSDPSENGLQVGRGEGEVETVAFAVDAAVETIDAAANWDADMLVVHHGLSWGGIDRVTGRAYERIRRLVEHEIDLYAAHIPLDSHPDLGNAAGLASLLELDDRRPFGTYDSETLGLRGELPDTRDIGQLEALLIRELDHGGEGVRVLDVGVEEIDSIAIVTGAGSDWLDEAVEAGVDAFLTGEGSGELYHRAKESEMTVFLCGHYATETFGVQALSDLVDTWGPTTTYFDAPTGL